MSIFHHHTVTFTQPDPLGDGLGDEIAAEQHEAEAITSLEDISAEELNKKWNLIVDDVKRDPDWIVFSED